MLDSKSSVCMDNNSKYTNYTRHIARRVHSVIDGENLNCATFIGVKEV